MNVTDYREADPIIRAANLLRSIYEMGIGACDCGGSRIDSKELRECLKALEAVRFGPKLAKVTK